MKIAHIADLHIRSLSRHDEYREVINAFVESCKSLDVDCIFIGGDTYHTKTSGISSEYIDFLSWTLKHMATVGDVHIILGNHDFNVHNKTRLDAISPIVNALGDEKIKLYRDSGVYPLSPDHNLGVFSIFDRDCWDKVVPTPGKFNIAAFHGAVNTAVTELGWSLTSDVTLDTFKGYDVVMLGDIHKTQYLGYREINGKDVPWIAYPGSTLQQNYAESLDHGYLLWDLGRSEHSVQFIKLPNPKPYITVEWKKDFQAVTVPNNSRVRVRHNRNLTQEEIESISQHLKSFNASEVTFTLNRNEAIRQTVRTGGQEGKNFHNVETLLKMMKEVGSTYNFTDDDWDSIEKYVEGYVSQSTKGEEIVRNIKWSLRELKFDNILGYGEGNKVNFDRLGGVTGIFGPNRIGKSSIIGALAYCLFNDSDRGSIKNLDMINVRKNHAYARAVLDVNGTDYVVERQSVKNFSNKGVNASTSVNLFKIIDGDAVDLNGEQRSDTDKLIRQIIGSSDDFMLTSLSVQGDIDRFIKEGSSYRKKVLNRFLDIDFFDDIHALSKQESSSLKSEIKSLQSIQKYDTTSIDERLALIEVEVRSLESDRDMQLDSQESSLSRLSQLNSQKKILLDLKQRQDELKECCDSIERTTEDVSIISKKIIDNQKKVQSLNKELQGIDVASLKGLLTDLNKLKEERLRIELTIKHENDSIDRKKRSIKVLSEVPCGDSFPSCKFIKDAHENKSLLQESINSSKELNERLEEILGKVTSIESSGIDSMIKRESEIKSELSKLELEAHKFKIDIELKEQRLSLLNQQKSSFSVGEESSDITLQTIEKLINDEATTLRSIKDNVSKINSKISELSSSSGVLNEQRRNIVEIQNKLTEKLARLKLHEFITNSFSKKGLPSKVLSEQLPLINQQISQALAGIVDFTVELECDDASSLEIYINYGDSKRAIELCSGMEKMISSIAIRAALVSVSVVPRSDMLIIDEGFGVLDESGIESCKKLLSSLKEFFKSIIIISHVPGIKDIADFIIEVQRVEKDSRVSA